MICDVVVAQVSVCMIVGQWRGDKLKKVYLLMVKHVRRT